MKLLLLLCLLSLLIGPASAQDIEEVTVKEGANAILPCRSNSAVEEFDWKKDEKEVFLFKKREGGSFHYDSLQDEYFKGRVSVFKAGSASIQISSTKLNDSGKYLCVLGPLENSKQKFYIQLNVEGVLKIRKISGAAPEPSIKPEKSNGDRTLLRCKAYGVPQPVVEWRDSAGNKLPSKESTFKDKEGRFHVTSDVTVTKTDNYTCVATQEKIHHQISNTFPQVFKVYVSVAEGVDKVLPCSLRSKENIEKMVFDWKKDDKEVFLYKDGIGQDAQFNGRVSHFKDELKNGNASIKIKNTKKADSGIYICHFPAKQESNIELHVVQSKGDSAVPALSSAVAVLSVLLVVNMLYVQAA